MTAKGKMWNKINMTEAFNNYNKIVIQIQIKKGLFLK